MLRMALNRHKLVRYLRQKETGYVDTVSSYYVYPFVLRYHPLYEQRDIWNYADIETMPGWQIYKRWHSSIWFGTCLDSIKYQDYVC